MIKDGGAMMLKQKRKKWKSKTLQAVTSVALAAAIAAGPASVGHAVDIWSVQQEASQFEAEGDVGSAAKLWHVLLDHFLSEDSYENAALYAKDLGHYYDGRKDYEKAIQYYEIENENWLKVGNNWGAADMQRAEEIRLTLDLYVSIQDEKSITAQSMGSSGKLAKFEPAYGAYLGLYSESDPEMGNYFTRSEQFYNKKHAIYLAYTQWGKDFPARYAENAKEAGGALQIGFEPDDGLNEVKDGDYIRKWAREAKATGIPIFLRYASEMNGAWTKWNGNPDEYIAKWRMVHDIMKKEAPNVAMVWSPGDVPRGTMDAYYPGDEYVDWVGVSLYTEPYEHGNTSISSLGISPVERLDELYSLYADRKPIMISETAVAHTNHKDGKVWTDWAAMNLDRLYSVMTKKYPRLKAITYFNRDQGKDNSFNDYLLRNNKSMMEAYKTIIADPYFLTKVETGAKPQTPVGYKKAEGNVSFAKKLKIAPYIKIPDIHIGRVEYLLNGAKLAEANKAPYAVLVHAGSVPDGSVLEAAVYNTDGIRIAARSLALSPVVSVSIDGKDYGFEQPPVVLDGSTLAPVRAIFNALGAEVDWDPATQTATGRKGSQTVSITIGRNTVKKGSEAVELQVPAQLVNGYTMVPARFVGEAFGGVVTWDDKTRTVIISTK
jgi:hypothetical protein